MTHKKIKSKRYFRTSYKRRRDFLICFASGRATVKGKIGNNIL